MALVPCSECGREISDKAVSCPGCGAPVASLPISQTRQRKPSPRKGIRGRIVWITAAILIVAYLISSNIVTPEEKAKQELSRLSSPIAGAATFVIYCEDRRARKNEPGSYLRRQDIAACDAGDRKFMDMFESSSDELAATLCAPRGYLSYKRQDVPVFDQACKSRDL